MLPRRQLLAAPLGALAPLRAAMPRRPNFLFILTDDHHFQCLGAAGNPHIRTPHLDRLAGEGVNFTNAIISTSQCAPSRGILLTGLECFQNGVRSNGALSFRPDLGPTAMSQLRGAGYDTCLIGKWHIETPPGPCGFAQAPLWLPEGGSRYIDPTLRRGLDAPAEIVPGHITDLFTTAADGYLRAARRPFFLWLAYNAPHTPWQAPPEYQAPYAGKNWRDIAPPAHPRDAARFDWPTYYSVITHLDAAVGRLLDSLRRTGLWDNTVVFFLGDNGYMCQSKGLDGKVVHWEESIRVPCLAAGGPIRGGRRLDDCVASIDLPATWLAMAGLRPARRMAGRNLAPLLASGRGSFDQAFTVWDDGRPEALLPPRAVEPYRLVRTRTHKLVVWESGRQSLYDIRNDPREDRDLAADPGQARVLSNLRARLTARMKETGDRALAWLTKS